MKMKRCEKRRNIKTIKNGRTPGFYPTQRPTKKTIKTKTCEKRRKITKII
jgi:hypothetical protein